MSRDELEHQIDRATDRLDRAQHNLAEAECERDEWTEALERLERELADLND